MKIETVVVFVQIGIGIVKGSQYHLILLAVTKLETNADPVFKLQANPQVNRVIVFWLSGCCLTGRKDLCQPPQKGSHC